MFALIVYQTWKSVKRALSLGLLAERGSPVVNVSGSRSAVADAQRDMPRETQLDEEKIGMEEDVRLKPNTITHPLRRRLLIIFCRDLRH
jgi:hypothetical protein